MMTDSEDARVVMIGSVTGNDNTVGGGGVYPIADLKEPVPTRGFSRSAGVLSEC